MEDLGLVLSPPMEGDGCLLESVLDAVNFATDKDDDPRALGVFGATLAKRELC